MRCRGMWLMVACLVLWIASVAEAQEAPPVEAVKAELAKFQAERAEAAKKFTPAELVGADELATKSEAALKLGNTISALRLIGEARWSVPFTPVGLPENVSRILGRGRLRHGERVNCLTYTPDGGSLVSSSFDGTVRIWNLGNGRETLVYRGHENEKFSETNSTEKEKTNVWRVPAVAVSVDGKWVASAGAKEVHVWELTTGKLLHTLKGHTKDVTCLAFANKSATLLATGSDDKRLMLWDVPNEKVVFKSDEQVSLINSVTFSRDDSYLASVNSTGDLMMYGLKNSNKLTLSVNAAGGGAALRVVLLENGSGALVSGNDSKISLIAGPGGYEKVNEASTVYRFEGHTKGKVAALAATTDGKLMISGGDDQSVIVWDIAGRKPIRTFRGHVSPVIAAAVRPDGKQAATGDNDGNIKIWPLTTTDDHRLFADSTEPLWTTAFSPDGLAFATGGADKTVRIYDANTGKLTKTLPGHKSAVTAATYLTPEKLITASGDKTLKIWDVATGKAVDCTGHTSAVLAVAADQGKLIVSGSADRSVRAWSPDGKALWTWSGKSAVCSVAIQKGAQRVAVGTADGTLLILDTSGTGEPKIVGNVSAHQAGTLSVSYSPEGNQVATGGGDGTVRLWSTPENANPVRLMEYTPPLKSGQGNSVPVVTVSHSADSKYLVAGGAEGVVRVWEIASGSEFRGLRGNTSWVTAAAFAPDGRSVISVGEDKKARLFDLPRTEATAPPGHTKPACSVAISRDGKFIATGSDDNTVKVWEASTGKELATLLIPTSADTRPDAIAFLNSETVVVADKAGFLRTFDVKSGKETKSSPSSPGFALAVPFDGSKVALAYVKNRGMESGFEIYPTTGAPSILKNNKKINCAALSPDAAWGIIGDEQGTLQIWDLNTKDRVRGDWPLFKVAVADVGLTPDRKTLVAVDADGTVKVANAETREVTKSLEKVVSGGVNGLMVSPKSDSFCTLSGTGELKAYDMSGKELRKWKLPFAPNAAVYTADGKKIVTANADGTSFILDMP